VQAESPREAQNAKPKTEGQESENAVTAEAIRMAREASGSDSGTTRTPNTSASPNPSPTPPPQQYVKGPNLAFTGNSSPANDRIEDNNNKQEKMSGEVMGADGASGIPGKRVGVDRNRLKETLRKVASSGIQVAGTMAGALTGRGTVVIDSAGYRLLNPVTSDARGIVGGS